jgi:hypothetical protein
MTRCLLWLVIFLLCVIAVDILAFKAEQRGKKNPGIALILVWALAHFAYRIAGAIFGSILVREVLAGRGLAEYVYLPCAVIGVISGMWLVALSEQVIAAALRRRMALPPLPEQMFPKLWKHFYDK